MSTMKFSRHNQGQEQEKQSRHSRVLQSEDVNSSRNRLRVTEDGSRAHCELIALNPFTSALGKLSYENSLAMQLAIRHLNEGNGSLVSELTDLPNSCPISFSASFADTRRDSNHAFAFVDELTVLPYLTEHAALSTNSTTVSTPQNPSPEEVVTSETTSELRNNKTNAFLPCAFVGAIDSAISKTTALVTGLREFPQISPGSTSRDLSDPIEFPLFGRTSPDDHFQAESFIRFLYYTLNVRHIFVIFEPHPFTESNLRSIREAIRNLGIAPQRDREDNDESTFLYLQERIVSSEKPEVLSEVIDDLKDSEFRFVISLTRKPTMNNALMEIAYDRGAAGTPESNYHWWFFGGSLGSALNSATFPKDSPLAKAYSGTGNIEQVYDKDGFKFKEFLRQSSELKRELYSKFDNNDDDQKWLFAPDIPFLNENEWFLEGADDFYFNTAAFTYDATVLLGLSACSAVSGASGSGAEITSPSLFLTGSDYFDTIKETNFTGLTGEILLDQESGSRNGRTVTYTINNWLPFDTGVNDTVKFRQSRTHVFAPGVDGHWEEIRPFVFNGGKTSLGEEPDLPPVNVKYQEVDSWLIVVSALCCFAIVMKTIGCAIWVIRNKDSRIVRASQPAFLLILCFGIAVVALSIIPGSIEHVSWVQSKAVCNSWVGLLMIGIGILSSTLLAKTYRINRIMDSAKNFRRIKLSVADTIYPVAIIFVFNITMVSLMVRFAPIDHEYIPVDYDKFDRPILLYPTCNSSYAYTYTMLGVNMVVGCLALFQTWRARHLSTEFAESKYIFNALLIVNVVLLLSIPVRFLVENSPNADTFIITFATTAITGTTIGFIFVPKMRMLNKLQRPSKVPTMSLSTKSSTIIPTSRSRPPSGYGEKILTKKSQEQLFSEVKKLERKLKQMEKEKESLKLENARLLKRLEELSGDREGIDKDGENRVPNAITWRDCSAKSNETFEFNSGAISNVMGDESHTSTEQDVNSKGIEKTKVTMPGKLDDLDKVEESESESESDSDSDSDSEAGDIPMNDSGQQGNSSLKSKGSILRRLSSLSGKLRSDRTRGTSNLKQSVEFSPSVDE